MPQPLEKMNENKTLKVSEITLKELAKAGVLFLVLGIAVWRLWMNQEESSERLHDEVKELRLETKQCQDNAQDILFKQNSEMIKVIERNTEALKNCYK